MGPIFDPVSTFELGDCEACCVYVAFSRFF